jgi:hypothetical protein
MVEPATARGSKLQVQIYVNRRPGELTAAVLGSLPSLAGRTRKIGWTVPLEHEGFAEPKDRDFLRAVGYEDLVDNLAEFWPARGPVWDALGVSVFPTGRHGVVLAEGKSYPREMHGPGTKASETSRTRIAHSIEWTQRQLGISQDAERWLGPLYQTANRLAHVFWLRDRGVEAWLIHLLFIDDATHVPTTRSDWETGLRESNKSLGIADLELPWVGHAFLPGLSADELTRPPTVAQAITPA